MGFGAVFHRQPGAFMCREMLALIELRCGNPVGVCGEIVEFGGFGVSSVA
jgi:hypothetical protein